jgi:hypothetical protein
MVHDTVHVVVGETDPDTLLGGRILATIVGGNVVYDVLAVPHEIETTPTPAHANLGD